MAGGPAISLYWPSINVKGLIWTRVLGEVLFLLMTSSQTLSESTAGNPAAAADGSSADTPARWHKTANQSAMCMNPSTFVPTALGGRKPPLTQAFTAWFVVQHRSLHFLLSQVPKALPD